MSRKQFTLVHYFVPEDHDNEDTYNAFGVNKHIDDIRLTDIIEKFPMPGEYHFRFKYKLNNLNVWMDINNTNCKLPKIGSDMIIMKVTRKSWERNDGAHHINESIFYII